jgi:hypothetical protein
MIETCLSIVAAAVVFLAAVLRLNMLKAARHSVTVWRVLEVLGLAGLMGGTMGVIGEWFLPQADFHAETIVITSLAVFCVGISRGPHQLCQVVARLQGWDGQDRRAAPRA